VDARTNAIIIGEGASTMDIGRTQLFNSEPRHRLDAGSYGTMGIGMGFVVAAAVVHPDKPIVSVSGDSAIGFSAWRSRRSAGISCRSRSSVFNNGGIGPGHAEHAGESRSRTCGPNALIYGARYDKMMEAFGGKGWFVENPKDLKAALERRWPSRARARQRPHLPGVGPQAKPAGVSLAQLIGWSDGISRGEARNG
jgi:thiamine pyrophosphate-dependent acetolactate synthase large subunit-like protein